MATFTRVTKNGLLIAVLCVVTVILVSNKHLSLWSSYRTAASKVVKAVLEHSEMRRGLSQHKLTTDDEADSVTKPKRRALVIVGHDRSGTTFLSDLFNSDLRVFNVYEPLWVTKYWKNMTRGVLDALKGLVSCQFTETRNGIHFLKGMSTAKMWKYRSHSNALTSSYFCNSTKDEGLFCQDLSANPHYVDDICLHQYKYSATKLSIIRMPDQNCSLLFPRVFRENPNTDIRVLHIVRDPRANINSRLKVTYFPDHPHPIFVSRVQDVCHEVLRDLTFFQNLAEEFPGLVKIIRYRDMSLRPLEIARDLYKFAGFEWEERVEKWIKDNTNPSKEKLEEGLKHPYETVRNSSANVEKWKKESPAVRVKVIEDICEPLLEELQLEKVAHILVEQEAIRNRTMHQQSVKSDNSK